MLLLRTENSRRVPLCSELTSLHVSLNELSQTYAYWSLLALGLDNFARCFSRAKKRWALVEWKEAYDRTKKSKYFLNLLKLTTTTTVIKLTTTTTVLKLTTTTTVRAMDKNQILLEISPVIAAMLNSNGSYFSASSYMKRFFADGIIRCLLYDDFL